MENLRERALFAGTSVAAFSFVCAAIYQVCYWGGFGESLIERITVGELLNGAALAFISSAIIVLFNLGRKLFFSKLHKHFQPHFYFHGFGFVLASLAFFAVGDWKTAILFLAIGVADTVGIAVGRWASIQARIPKVATVVIFQSAFLALAMFAIIGALTSWELRHRPQHKRITYLRTSAGDTFRYHHRYQYLGTLGDGFLLRDSTGSILTLAKETVVAYQLVKD